MLLFFFLFNPNVHIAKKSSMSTSFMLSLCIHCARASGAETFLRLASNCSLRASGFVWVGQRDEEGQGPNVSDSSRGGLAHIIRHPTFPIETRPQACNRLKPCPTQRKETSGTKNGFTIAKHTAGVCGHSANFDGFAITLERLYRMLGAVKHLVLHQLEFYIY